MFPYTHQLEEIFNEHRETTRGRDLDITGLSYDSLIKNGPQQWPFATEGEVKGKVRLYTEWCFSEHKVVRHNLLMPFSYKQLQTDNTSARYPLHLLTGRLRDQWHGMSRTGNVAQLFNHVEEPVISMHEDDMQRRSIKDGDIVKVIQSAR